MHATDGTIGRVQGLVVELTDDHVTHVLLDEGQLWGEGATVAPTPAGTAINFDRRPTAPRKSRKAAGANQAVGRKLIRRSLRSLRSP